MPIVSVIIPAFNAEHYIKETILSVLSQDFRDFEIIVVNDGSTDCTAVMVSSLSDSRIRLISQCNSGHSAARNRGIRESNGAYLAFLDADDVWVPEKLSQQVSFLNNNPDYAMVYTQGEMVNSLGQYLRPFSVNGVEGFILEQLLGNALLIHASSVLARTNIIKKMGGYNERLRGYEDWDLWLRIASSHKVGYLGGRAFFKWRITESGNSARTGEGGYIADALTIVANIFAGWKDDKHTEYMRDDALSYVYGMEGFLSLYYGNAKKARKYFRMAIKYRPLAVKAYGGFVHTLLGARAANWIHQRIWLSIKTCIEELQLRKS